MEGISKVSWKMKKWATDKEVNSWSGRHTQKESKGKRGVKRERKRKIGGREGGRDGER